MKTQGWLGFLQVVCCGAAAALVALSCDPSGVDTTGEQTLGEGIEAISLPIEAVAQLAPAAGSACADGTVEQEFAAGIVGCAGAVTFPNRATLCGAGYHPLNAQTWQTSRGQNAPLHHYWTNDALMYSGTGSGNCSAEYSGGTLCPANEPMRVCARTNLDPEGNRCNWVNCAFDVGTGAPTPNSFFGGCAGNTTAGTLCVPDSGCVNGTAEQTFTRGMVGCAGSVLYASAEQLCTAGYTLAREYDWIQYRAGAAPTHNYWTSFPSQHYSGTASACVATNSASDPSCPSDTPMRVCVDGGTDPEGNHCNWFNCDSLTYGTAPNEYLGGCWNNKTAGALCVPTKSCADGTIEQQWSRFMIGCSGRVTWANRDSLCGPREIAIPANLWPGVHKNLDPTHNYWTGQRLNFNGNGSGNCSVSITAGFQCLLGQSMSICTDSGSDPEGNQCVWTHCGYETNTPEHFLGGCSASAGTLCMTGP